MMKPINFIISVVILLLIPYINIFCEENPFATNGKLVFYSSTSIIPFELIGHKIFVKVKINNSPKNYRFLFDTGAFTCISEKLATKLTLKREAVL